MKTSATTLLKRYENTQLLRKCIDICAVDKHICFDVVQKKVNGINYRCLYGVYMDEHENPLTYMDPDAPGQFGITDSEFTFLFGVSATLSERRIFVDEHLRYLYEKVQASVDIQPQIHDSVA